MNHIVILDASAGELEKILSGTKSMLIKEYDAAQPAEQMVNPGDTLYFLRNEEDCALRVKATVVRALFFTNHMNEDLPRLLKEMQPRLQLTEEQYNYWSEKNQATLVELEGAEKVAVMQVAPDRIGDRSGWIAFEELYEIILQRSL